MSGREGTVVVSVIDPAEEAVFDEWFAVLRLTDLERRPEGPGWQRRERQARALDKDGPEEHQCLVARDQRGEVVGIADLEMFRRDNTHFARLDVRVLPAQRRRGVGSAIVEEAAAIARAAGRTELCGSDESPTRADYVDLAEPFARRLGFTVAARMTRRGLAVPLVPAHEAALRAHPHAHPVGYTLLTWGDRWPDEYLEDRCELGRRMSTDAPSGDQEIEEEVWDHGRVRAIEASFAAENRAKVTTAARDDASGRLVAFTEVVVPLGAPESSWQHDTLVLREHRGHALGFAVKVANLWETLERHPAVRRISTWNVSDNTHMIAVNDAMGFEVEAESNYWLKPLAATGGAPPTDA